MSVGLENERRTIKGNKKGQSPQKRTWNLGQNKDQAKK